MDLSNVIPTGIIIIAPVKTAAVSSFWFSYFSVLLALLALTRFNDGVSVVPDFDLHYVINVWVSGTAPPSFMR